jgi:hypothetical protein
VEVSDVTWLVSSEDSLASVPSLPHGPSSLDHFTIKTVNSNKTQEKRLIVA